MRLACLFSLAILSFPHLALAAPGCSVFASKAQVGNHKPPVLEVGQGSGFDAIFIPTGEIIQTVWLDDKTRVNISFDGKLCERTGKEQADCSQSGATVIHLEQHEPIKFPNQISSPDGSTGLSVRTVDSKGRPKFYKFTVIPVAAGKPVDCSSLTVYPDPQRLAPALPRATEGNQQPSSQVSTPAYPVQQTKASSTANKLAAAAQAGLKLARTQR